jgi:NADPH:quinone reductase-like Zn-dependent oxidoreductase
MTDNMKAIIHEIYGPPRVLKLVDLPTPIPKSTEVLIKIHYATVNRTDTGFRSAEYVISRLFSGLFKPKNKILGSEFAGEIIGVGADVTRLQVGDKVFGYNDSTFGAYAEFMALPENATMSILSANKTYQDCVALTEGAHYALNDIRAAKVEAGQRVLVNGATGAIGSAAVQLIKYIGAHVTAVCETQHIALVKSLGADHVIDYTTEDFTQLQEQFDFVFDAVGKSTFGKCKRLLKSKGIYISTELGPGAQNPFLALITPLLGGKKLLFPIPTMKQADINYLKELHEKGAFNPVIDRIYTLEEIVEATHYVENGFKTGNVLIKVAQ